VGQYWQIYNETKKEMLNPWAFGEVAKLHEWPMDGPGGMHTALVVLLLDVSSLGEGGGDFNFRDAPKKLQALAGSWRGDRISIVGDYSHLTEFGGYAVGEKNPGQDFEDAYKDISKAMVELMSYDRALAQWGLCGSMVTPAHVWQDTQYKPWGDAPDKRKPTLASVNGWGEETKPTLAPDMIFRREK
jgi:hypothetical protein